FYVERRHAGLGAGLAHVLDSGVELTGSNQPRKFSERVEPGLACKFIFAQMKLEQGTCGAMSSDKLLVAHFLVNRERLLAVPFGILRALVLHSKERQVSCRNTVFTFAPGLAQHIKRLTVGCFRLLNPSHLALEHCDIAKSVSNQAQVIHVLLCLNC